MASVYLTPTAVTKGAAVILHEEGKLLRRVNRQYDAQQPDGRKAGGSIKIRMPNQYTVRRTTTMNVQDIAEKSETLTIAEPFGVDLNFTDSELALSIEDFSNRILRPAIKRLVSEVESFFYLDFCNSVANMVDNDGAAVSFLNVMQANQRLRENLAPMDMDDLSLFLTPTHNTKLIDALKGLFVPAAKLGGQYTGAEMLPVAGVGVVAVSSHATDLTTGTAVEGDTTYNINGAGQEGASIVVDTGATTFKAGEVLTFAGSNAVHPETKANLGYLKQFAVASDYAGGAGSIAIKTISGGDTGIVASGARQNVSASPTTTGAVSKIGAGNAETLNRSLYFHRDSYAVSFADLENPRKYGAWGDVQMMDNISVRIWRQGDIVNGSFPTRLDILCGGKCIRPELACRIHADG